MTQTKKKSPTVKKRPTALKREIQNAKKHMINRAFKSRVRTATRHFESSLAAGDKERTTEYLNLLYSLADKAVKKGIYKKNKGDRIKSRATIRSKELLSS